VCNILAQVGGMATLMEITHYRSTPLCMCCSTKIKAPLLLSINALIIYITYGKVAKRKPFAIHIGAGVCIHLRCKISTKTLDMPPQSKRLLTPP
jgi:hypothetical protein